MKKLLLIISLLLAITKLFAQNNPVYQLIGKTPEQVRVIADRVMSLTKTEYEFSHISERSSRPSYYALVYREKGEEDWKKQFYVEFRKYMIGEDKNLDIIGEPIYFLFEVRGKFLDIFPIWQRYFSPNSVQEETVRKWREEAVVYIDGLKADQKFLLTNESGLWQIRAR